ATDLRLLGYTGAIVSFEPDPKAFAILEQRSSRDSGWHVRNVALGRATGTLTLNLAADSVYNSFRSPSCAETDADYAGSAVVGQVQVPVATLNDVVPEVGSRYGVKRLHLKMDTQGFDAEVFAGAQDVIDGIVSMQSELPVKNIYSDTPE